MVLMTAPSLSAAVQQPGKKGWKLGFVQRWVQIHSSLLDIIVKVLEKLERPKQMRLDGRKDDDVMSREPKGRKFR